MATVQTILDALEDIAPSRFAFDFDHIGLQVGSADAKVERAVVSLDRSLAAIDFASTNKSQLLLAHHPLIWNPLDSIVESKHAEKGALQLIRNGINFIAAHTNWDCAKGGINDALADLLHLSDVRSFGMANPLPMPKRGTDGSATEQPAGRVGKLPSGITLTEFTRKVDEVLGTRSLAWGAPDRNVRQVAVVGGAADSEWLAALKAGADVFITGEVRQNIALEASESGLAILASGHYATEHPGCKALRDRMAIAVPDVEWLLFEPTPGLGGRPLG